MKTRFLTIKEGWLMVMMNKLALLEHLITKLSEFNTVEIKKNQISKMYLQLLPDRPEIVPFISVLSIMSVHSSIHNPGKLAFLSFFNDFR